MKNLTIYIPQSPKEPALKDMELQGGWQDIKHTSNPMFFQIQNKQKIMTAGRQVSRRCERSKDLNTSCILLGSQKLRHSDTYQHTSIRRCQKNEKIKWCSTFRILQTYIQNHSHTHTNKRTLVKDKNPFMLFFILFNSCKSGGHANYLSAQTAPFLHLLAIVVEFSRHFLGALSSEPMRALQLEPAPGAWRKMFEHFALCANLFLNTFLNTVLLSLLLFFYSMLWLCDLVRTSEVSQLNFLR